MSIRKIAARTALGLAAATALTVGAGSAATASEPVSAAGDIGVSADGRYYSKVYKNVWKPSSSFTNKFGPGAGAPSTFHGIYWAGQLGSGSNYFYCQVKTDMVRIASDSKGFYLNNWWLLTDDDSGNKNVWVNAVNVSGGGNYQRIPGVPIC
jgi:hypothetical protein